MSWPTLRKVLVTLPPDRLLDLLKELHDMSPQNKAFLRARCLPIEQDAGYLDECRRKVVRAIYPETARFPGRPRFADAKKVIAEYNKATRDLNGTLDLQLLYVERGTQFTDDFGDIDEPFYIALETMLEKFATGLKNAPSGQALYAKFRSRLRQLHAKASNFGWGYGDTLNDVLSELEAVLA
jgi:hypothetical protein